MDTSPTTLFSNYEQDFQQIIASIRDKLEGDPKAEGVGKLLFRDECGPAELVWGLTYAFLWARKRATQDGIKESGDGTGRS